MEKEILFKYAGVFAENGNLKTISNLIDLLNNNKGETFQDLIDNIVFMHKNIKDDISRKDFESFLLIGFRININNINFSDIDESIRNMSKEDLVFSLNWARDMVDCKENIERRIYKA